MKGKTKHRSLSLDVKNTQKNTPNKVLLFWESGRMKVERVGASVSAQAMSHPNNYRTVKVWWRVRALLTLENIFFLRLTTCQPGNIPIGGHVWPLHWLIFIVLKRCLSDLRVSNSQGTRPHYSEVQSGILCLFPDFLPPTYFPWRQMRSTPSRGRVYLAGRRRSGEESDELSAGINKSFAPIKGEQVL